MNTRILHVFGNENGDLVFKDALERGTIDKEQLWEDSYTDQEQKQVEIQGQSFTYKAYKFGDVDSNFTAFVVEQLIEPNDLPDLIVYVGVEPTTI